MAKTVQTPNIVCLGGGIGTSNLLKGLKKYTQNLTVVTSMADDGGSSGRIRKAYNMMPPGDIVSCIAALIPDEQKELMQLLTYRFPGRELGNKNLGGHKLGNLIMLAEYLRTNNFYKALEKTKKMFGITADLFPATEIRTHLSAITKDGRRIHSETTMDLALYSEPHGLKKMYITPKNPPVNKKMIERINQADLIVSGPGDLYTNQLPVLVIPQIKQAILESKAKKIFVLNIANKPFETKGFTLQNFITALIDHLEIFPFDTIIANNNQSTKIPAKYRYKYIKVDPELRRNKQTFTLIEKNLVNEIFPLYHNPKKLANVIMKLL